MGTARAPERPRPLSGLSLFLPPPSCPAALSLGPRRWRASASLSNAGRGAEVGTRGDRLGTGGGLGRSHRRAFARSVTAEQSRAGGSEAAGMRCVADREEAGAGQSGPWPSTAAHPAGPSLVAPRTAEEGNELQAAESLSRQCVPGWAPRVSEETRKVLRTLLDTDLWPSGVRRGRPSRGGREGREGKGGGGTRRRKRFQGQASHTVPGVSPDLALTPHRPIGQRCVP